MKVATPRIDAPQAKPAGPAFRDPAPHPLLAAEAVVACPACGLPVGARRGVLNRHRVRSPLGDDPAWTDGAIRASPLGADGWCRGQSP